MKPLFKPLGCAAIFLVLFIGAPRLLASESSHGSAHAPEHAAEHAKEHVAEHSAAHSSEHKNEHAQEHADHGTHRPKHKPGFLAAVIKPIEVMFEAFLVKLDQMRSLDEDNEFLRKRVAELELKNAKLEHAVLVKEEKHRAETIKHESLTETGTESGRTIASLGEPDRDALKENPPKKIFEQALEQFNEGEYASAAKDFVLLVEKTDLKSAETYFFTGLSLYQVGNYRKAIAYLERSEALANGEDISFGPRALAWISRCYFRLNDKPKERQTVFKLIQRYPKSKEARRLSGHA